MGHTKNFIERSQLVLHRDNLLNLRILVRFFYPPGWVTAPFSAVPMVAAYFQRAPLW